MVELKRKVTLKRKGTPAPPPKSNKWWLWLIPLLAVAGGAIYFLARDDGNASQQVASSITQTESSNAPSETTVVSPSESETTATPDDVLPTEKTEETTTPGSGTETPPPAEEKPVATSTPYKAGEAYKVYQFPYGKSGYSKPDAELDKLAKVLKDNPNLKIQIIAYTDKMGSVAFNQALSEKRARSIHDYLVSRGIDKSRLSCQGNGISTKYGSNAENRRAEFILN